MSEANEFRTKKVDPDSDGDTEESKSRSQQVNGLKELDVFVSEGDRRDGH